MGSNKNDDFKPDNKVEEIKSEIDKRDFIKNSIEGILNENDILNEPSIIVERLASALPGLKDAGIFQSTELTKVFFEVLCEVPFMYTSRWLSSKLSGKTDKERIESAATLRQEGEKNRAQLVELIMQSDSITQCATKLPADFFIKQYSFQEKRPMITKWLSVAMPFFATSPRTISVYDTVSRQQMTLYHLLAESGGSQKVIDLITADEMLYGGKDKKGTRTPFSIIIEQEAKKQNGVESIQAFLSNPKVNCDHHTCLEKLAFGLDSREAPFNSYPSTVAINVISALTDANFKELDDTKKMLLLNKILPLCSKYQEKNDAFDKVLWVLLSTLKDEKTVEKFAVDKKNIAGIQRALLWRAKNDNWNSAKADNEDFKKVLKGTFDNQLSEENTQKPSVFFPPRPSSLRDYITKNIIQSTDPRKIIKALKVYQAIDNQSKEDLDKALSINTGTGFGKVTSHEMFKKRLENIGSEERTNTINPINPTTK